MFQELPLYQLYQSEQVVRFLTAISLSALLTIILMPAAAPSQEAMIDAGLALPISQSEVALCGGSNCDQWWDSHCGADCNCPNCNDLSWLHNIRVGYDRGFLIASKRELDLGAGHFPFRMQLNGWGQLRHTVSKLNEPNPDLNQMQLKRGRLAFSGSAFNPNFGFMIQLDGRSSSGDDMRLLDYVLSYDVGHDQFGLDRGELGFRTGKYKMPFTMARWFTGQEFEFTDRSVASMFFDVNRSFGWGLYGETRRIRYPITWEIALFNGLVTGGAETGSSGTLDDNFAYSGRIYAIPIGEWGEGSLADIDEHDHLAMRIGFGFASTDIDRAGTTEFNTLRVVDSGDTLATILSLLPSQVNSYAVSLYSIDASVKRHGWSATMEYYFRTIDDFKGATVSDLFDHGFWSQLGYFIVPGRFQLLTRWSRVVGNSGTLGAVDQSSDELAAGFAWYFESHHRSKWVVDMTRLNGAPISSASLDINPGDDGWLFRSQIQFSF